MNNVNPNVNQANQIANTMKAQASGAVQDIVPVKKQQEPTRVRHVQDLQESKEAHLERLQGKDQVYFSVKMQKDLEARRQVNQLEGRELPPHQEGPGSAQEPGNRDIGALKWVKGLFQTILQTFTKPEEHLPQQPLPTQSPGAGVPQEEPRGTAVNRFLAGWLELSPTTITGLEKFLEVEYSHQQDDYQLFLQRQMVKLVKETRRALEEQHLAGSRDLSHGEAVARRAMVGVALLGYAYYKLSLRRKEKADSSETLLAEVRAQEEEGAVQGIKKRNGERRLRKAKAYLKQVEQELQGALAEGADPGRIHGLLQKIVDLTDQISELAAEEIPVAG